ICSRRRRHTSSYGDWSSDVCSSDLEAEAMVAELEARAREHYVTPVALCIAHLGLRNVDQVFHWLDRAYEDRRGWLTYMKVDPIFDAVRDEPRYVAFLKRMNL